MTPNHVDCTFNIVMAQKGSVHCFIDHSNLQNFAKLKFWYGMNLSGIHAKQMRGQLGDT